MAASIWRTMRWKHLHKSIKIVSYEHPGFLFHICDDGVSKDCVRFINFNVLPSRNTTVVLDPEVQKMLEEEKIKVKQLPGKMSLKTVEIPERMEKSIDVLVKKYPLKQLAVNAQKLAVHLWNRRLPIETKQLRLKAKMIEEKEREKESRIDVTSLSEEQISKLELLRRKKVLRMLRSSTYHWEPIRYDSQKAFLYLIGRMAQDYASVLQCFNEILVGDPEYTPRTLFDMGSGVGSVIWAANKTWGEKLFEYYCCDVSGEMNTLARLLLQDGDANKSMKIKGVHFRQFPPSDQVNKFDMVVCAFTLLEVPSAQERLDMITYLWNMTNDYLILIENGTNAGFKCISEARDFILNEPSEKNDINEDRHILAPCPHDLTCPKLLGNVPCSFSVDYRPLKISLANIHHSGVQAKRPLSGYNVFIQHMRNTKQKMTEAAKIWKGLPESEKEVHNQKARQINTENIKQMVESRTLSLNKNQSAKNQFLYSYVIIKKEERKSDRNWPRQILEINKTPKCVECRLCCGDGKLRDIALTKKKSGKLLYRCASKSKWGDRVPFILTDKISTESKGEGSDIATPHESCDQHEISAKSDSISAENIASSDSHVDEQCISFGTDLTHTNNENLDADNISREYHLEFQMTNQTANNESEDADCIHYSSNSSLTDHKHLHDSISENQFEDEKYLKDSVRADELFTAHEGHTSHDILVDKQILSKPESGARSNFSDDDKVQSS